MCCYLFICHVKSCNMTFRANQLTQHKAIHASATAKVQDAAFLKGLGGNQTTSIVPTQSHMTQGLSDHIHSTVTHDTGAIRPHP